MKGICGELEGFIGDVQDEENDTGLVQEFGRVAVDPKPIAAILAGIAFFATKRTIPTLATGMLSLYLVYWLQL